MKCLECIKEFNNILLKENELKQRQTSQMKLRLIGIISPSCKQEIYFVCKICHSVHLKNVKLTYVKSMYTFQKRLSNYDYIDITKQKLSKFYE